MTISRRVPVSSPSFGIQPATIPTAMVQPLLDYLMKEGSVRLQLICAEDGKELLGWDVTLDE
jgi:hypothetical protein